MFIATTTGGLNLLNTLPVEPAVYNCTFGDIYCAGTSIARCTLPLVGTCASASSVPAPAMVFIALASAVSYAAPVQVLVHFAPAFSASAGPFSTATGVSILSLSCPPSTLALVVEYIAPAPQWYAAPAPVVVYIELTGTREPSFRKRRDIPNVKMKIDLSVARCVSNFQVFFL